MVPVLLVHFCAIDCKNKYALFLLIVLLTLW
jgi:hypothetical protein